MKRAVNLSVFGALFFMILLMLLPYLAPNGGALFVLFYSLCFVLPAVSVRFISAKFGNAEGGLRLFPDGEGLRLSLPLILPSIAAVIFLANLTSYLLSFTGASSGAGISGGVFYVFLAYAVIPAVGEELLFRYIPLKLISPYSKKAALIVSAILFSAVHANLFQIPYALFAGLAFAFIDIISDSFMPSVIAHLLNNSLSVALNLFAFSIGMKLILSVFAVLLVLSVFAALLYRRKYAERFRAIRAEKASVFTSEFLALIALSLILAATSAFS